LEEEVIKPNTILKSVAYSFVIMLASYTVAAQQNESIKVQLGLHAIDDAFRKSQTVVPVFNFNSPEIEGIEDFGIKTGKKHATQTFKPILPDMPNCRDTGYTYFYFGGAENSPSKGYVLGIIGNKRSKDSISYLWIDRNMNFDLNDDGPPLKFYNKADFYLDLHFSHPNQINAIHIIRISRFDVGKNAAYKKLVNEHFQKNSGNKQFAGLENSFREQRINLRSTDVIIGSDSFKIALKDNNANGIFNEIDQDEIIVDTYGKEEMQGFSFPITKKETAFERNGKRYLVQSIDPTGKYIQFKEQIDATLEKQLVRGKKLPNQTIQHANDSLKNTTLRKFRRKPVYILYFNLDTPPSKEEIEILRTIHTQFGKKINIILLNYGDSRAKVHGWKLRNGIQFTVGMTTQEQLNKYYVESLPYSFLTRKRLKLAEINITSQEILKQLQQRYPSKKPTL
jgi:hypothetical protein